MGYTHTTMEKNTNVKTYFLSFLFLFALIAREGLCKTDHEVYFKDTEYELNIYKIYGAEKGKTLMIIGGIQGDEPGGYLSADLYADMALRKGTLIVVPRANFLSIIEHKRAINWDMNRRFMPVNSKEYYEDRIVEILKGLMAQSDFLLNLHEGSGFYRETYENNLKNPMRFGQSIIADADVYYSKQKEEELRLGDTARKVAHHVNELIDNNEYHFRFNNHKTFEKNTTHPEQRKSATFYALSTYGLPSFGIETSKEIKDIEAKVRFQTMIINAFMEEFGIVPENPKVALDTPKLKYLVFSVNNSQNIVARDGDEITVQKGDKLMVSQIEANYERGLSIDIVGVGSANDFNKEFEIVSPTKAVIRKDGYKCGEVSITLRKAEEEKQNFAAVNEILETPSPSLTSPKFKYLILELNGVRHVLSNKEHLRIVRGDKIKLFDVVVDGVPAKELTVNFLGFVGNKIKNTGEDRGYLINTAKDLWTKYSKGGKNLQYPIAISYKDINLSKIFVDIEEPKMNYIVIKHGRGEQRWYENGETIYVAPKDRIEIVDVKTNVSGNIGVKMNVSGTDVENKAITFDKKGGENYELMVTREGIVIGKTNILLGEPLAAQE